MARKYLDQLSGFIGKSTAEYSDLMTLECKHFFSGAALYVDGKIAITVTPVGLAMKLPAASKEYLLDNKQAELLKYFPKAPVKKDYVLFTNWQEIDIDYLNNYVMESILYVQKTLKSKK